MGKVAIWLFNLVFWGHHIFSNLSNTLFCTFTPLGTTRIHDRPPKLELM